MIDKVQQPFLVPLQPVRGPAFRELSVRLCRIACGGNPYDGAVATGPPSRGRLAGSDPEPGESESGGNSL